MAKILVVVDNDLDHDARVLREIKILEEAGHQLNVLCYSGSVKKENTSRSFEVHRIHIDDGLKKKLLPLVHRVPLFNIIWTSRIAQQIERSKPDFVLAHDLYMAHPARKAIEKTGSNTSLVLDLHENFPAAVLEYGWTNNKWKRLIAKPHKWKDLEKSYLKKADKVIVLHDSFNRRLQEKYDFLQNRITVFPNVPDLDVFKKVKYLEEYNDINLEKPIMLYFGMVAERRGIFDSLEALRLVLENEINLNYLIIGPVDKADKKEFEDYIQSQSLNNHIQYIPWISMEELPYFLDMADFCIAPFKVNPQHESGVANKIFQYMYGQKPIIASYCKPQAELISTYDCGIIYKNQQELVQAIQSLSQNKTMRLRQGKNGKKALLEHFTLEELSKPFLELFETDCKKVAN